MNLSAMSERWSIYAESLRLHAHQLLVWAYQDMRPHIGGNLDEPSITGLLCNAMKERLDLPETPSEYDRYDIGDQVPISPRGELGNNRQRLDMAVTLGNGRPRISYIFEAKRLRAGGFPIGRYTGTEGMGDFIECRYAQTSPEAVMVGFFHNKDVGYWYGELRRAFAEDAMSDSPRLGIRSHPTSVIIHPELRDEFESHHLRTDQSLIRMLHIFLDCT